MVSSCVSSQSVVAQSSGPSPSGELSDSLNKGEPKLPSHPHVGGSEDYQLLVLETALDNPLGESSPTLLGRKNLLPSKNKTSLCHCGIHGCLGMVVLGRAWTLS